MQPKNSSDSLQPSTALTSADKERLGVEVAYAVAQQYLADGQTGRVLSLNGLEKAIKTALIEVLGPPPAKQFRRRLRCPCCGVPLKRSDLVGADE
jgi:hypothetical protein